MRKLLLVLLCGTFFLSKAQTTYDQVYTLFQTKCTQSSCHNHNDAVGGLDLQGTGGNMGAKMSYVYNEIYFAHSNNSYCQAKHYKLTYPGNPYSSTLFRKINDDLAEDVVLNPNEGAPCPQDSTTLSVEEIELVRQWILYGCSQTSNVVDTARIHEYYTNGGFASIPNPPAAPDSSLGFQIHVGPVFIDPNTDIAYADIIDTHLPQAEEVNSVNIAFGDFGHHMFAFKILDTTNIQNAFYSIHPFNYALSLQQVVSVMDPFNFVLPQGTAFSFEGNTKLLINAHYINFSVDKVMACDLYLNFITQPVGTAKQIMQSVVWGQQNLAIPPGTDTTTVSINTNELVDDSIPIYLWMMNSHTHAHGVDFNVFDALPNGNKGTQFYDASCDGGDPGCQFPYFDYQHPPLKFFNPFRKVMLNTGMILEAKYFNDTPDTIFWGPTLQDEMMGVYFMYLYDTTGLGIPDTSTNINARPLNPVKIYPNPMHDFSVIDAGELNGGDQMILSLYDIVGRKVREIRIENSKPFLLPRGNLDSGIYLYKISNNKQTLTSGKIVVQ